MRRMIVLSRSKLVSVPSRAARNKPYSSPRASTRTPIAPFQTPFKLGCLSPAVEGLVAWADTTAAVISKQPGSKQPSSRWHICGLLVGVGIVGPDGELAAIGK